MVDVISWVRTSKHRFVHHTQMSKKIICVRENQSVTIICNSDEEISIFYNINNSYHMTTLLHNMYLIIKQSFVYDICYRGCRIYPAGII